MQTFSEIAHPRSSTDGRFVTKTLTEATGGTETDLSDPFAHQRAVVQAVTAERQAQRTREDALIEAASSGDAEVADRILAHLDDAQRRGAVRRIAQAQEWATWLEEDPFENSYAADMLPEGPQITALVPADDFRDEDGVNFAEYGDALADAWRDESRRLAQQALQG